MKKKEREKEIFEEVLLLFNNPVNCKEYKEIQRCDTYHGLLYLHGQKIMEMDLVTIVILLANGICKKAYDKATAPSPYADMIKGYIEDHLVFKCDEEEYEYDRKIRALQSPSIDGKSNEQYENYIKDYLNEKSLQVYNVMINWLSYEFSFIIAYNYHITNLKMSDVAKCIYMYFKPFGVIREFSKPIIKSLTEEEGYNIDVDGLL